MNTDIRKAVKNDFEKDSFKLIHSPVFRKTIEKVRKHRDNKLVTAEKRRNYLVFHRKVVGYRKEKNPNNHE